MGPEYHAPRRGVNTLMLGDLNANPGWARVFLVAPAALSVLWQNILRDTRLSHCTPAVEVPTWTDGRGCVGVIDHILHWTVPKEGGQWVDEASPFLSDHRLVVWDTGESLTRSAGPMCSYAPGIFRSAIQGIAGVYHAALVAARREHGARP